MRLLLQRNFAVILLDVNMPGMDGFETAALIRQRKDSESTPIIFVTAVGGTEIHQARGYSLGAVDYIFSPIVPEALKTKVSVFVELYKKGQQVRRLNEDLRKYAQKLEGRVQERTLELERANEQLKQLSDLKSHFTSTVSHELRSPLCVIQEGVNIILNGCAGPVTEDQRETLVITNRNIERLIRLVNNVLDLSQIESGQIATLFESNNLKDLVSEIYNLMKVAAGRKNLQFTLTLPEGDLVAVCDADKIRQVLINLVDNAIKFTGDGGRSP